jgi:hypothetical protein
MTKRIISFFAPTTFVLAVSGSAFAAAIGHSQVNTGWVVGYGTEGHLPGNGFQVTGLGK